jgi:hypothetical protein
VSKKQIQACEKKENSSEQPEANSISRKQYSSSPMKDESIEQPIKCGKMRKKLVHNLHSIPQLPTGARAPYSNTSTYTCTAGAQWTLSGYHLG